MMQERTQQAPAGGEDGDKTPETMGSFPGGAVDASSVPAGGAESDPGAASASDTGQGNGEGSPVVLSGRPPDEPSSWGRLSPTVRGRSRCQSQRLEGEPAAHQVRMEEETTDVLLATAYEWWTKPGSILNRVSWTTEDAVALMAGGPTVENKGELSVCMPKVCRKT